MPIYEYQCQACGQQTEVMQKMSDQPLVDCPTCNKPALTKMISATGFQLTGGGWYETDFKDKKPQPAAATPETPVAPAAAVETKAEPKTEKKSAAGSE